MMLLTKSGAPVHPIGIGTWGMGGFRETEKGGEEQAIEAIQYSISQGQNHIDTAELYGGGYTDTIVGRAIADTPREELFVADKLWRDSVAPGKVRPAVETMLKKLGSSYIDLLYIHSPWDDVEWQAAIPQIDELIDEGVIRHLGVSNFTISDLEQAIKIGRHGVVANQLRYNVLHKEDVTPAMHDFCTKNDVATVAYRPVERNEVENNVIIQAIAKKYQATPQQIALAWLVKQSVLTIPKSLKRDHIDQNLVALDIELTEADRKTLDEL